MKIKRVIKTISYLHKDQRIVRSILKALSFEPPLSWFINRSFYNFLYHQKILLQTQKGSYFSNVVIGTTNLCNAHCTMCPHVVMKRKKGIMAEKLFRKIIDELRNSGVKRITMSEIGEPLLDPSLIDRIKYTKTKIKDCKIKIFTNASLLTKEKTDKLVASQIDDIVISFNGYKNSYEKVMGLNFNQTLRKVNYLLSKKPKSLHAHLSCMLIRENANDIPKIIKFWESFADSIAINIPENWAGRKEIETPFTLPYPPKKWPCRGLFNTLNIYWNGDVVLCCRDHEASLIIGNVGKQSINEIWSSEKFKRIRRLHLSSKIDQIPLCKNCDTPILNATSWW